MTPKPPVRKPRTINVVCLECGRKYDKKGKTVMGTWIDTCDICGEHTACAAAGHDFGIYSNEEDRLQDEVQDKL